MRIQSWLRRQAFREGHIVSRFIARDIRRDVLVISTVKIDDGIITNVLYYAKGLVPQPEFEPVRELRIEELWQWTGQHWVGLPDGTSLVERVHDEPRNVS